MSCFYYTVNLDLSSGSCEVSVDNPMSSTSTGVTPVDINVDISTKSRDALVCPRFKPLWAFRSDFSTATSNEFPMIPYEAYDGQKENLYDFSYNQVGPDGEDGWFKVELKRDYKVGYVQNSHSAGGNGDGFGPFGFLDNPQQWDETNDGGPLDPSTAFKWTTKFDNYLSEGFDGQPTDTIFARVSFKLAYSQLPPQFAPEATNPSPRLRIWPLSNAVHVVDWVGFDDPPTSYTGVTINASRDSTVTPGLVDSFFHFDRTFVCGVNVTWHPTISYVPLFFTESYPPLSGTIYRAWRQSFQFMLHDTDEVALGSSIVPQGFYIMIKDIQFSHYTAPSNLNSEKFSRPPQPKISYEKGIGEDRHIWNS